MSMNGFEIRVTTDLLRPEVVGAFGRGIAMCKGDAKAHRLVVSVVSGGVAVDLTGLTATAYAQYGATKYQLSSATISGNRITAAIDSAVYANASGTVTLVVKLANGTTMMDATVAVVIGVIEQVLSDGAPVVPTANAWTSDMVTAYLDDLKEAVDSMSTLVTTVNGLKTRMTAAEGSIGTLQTGATAEATARANADTAMRADIADIRDALVLERDELDGYNLSDDGAFVAANKYHCWLIRVLPGRIIDTVSLDTGTYMAYGFTDSKPTATDTLSYAFPNGKKRKFVNAITESNVTVPDGCNWLVVQALKVETASIAPRAFILARTAV